MSSSASPPGPIYDPNADIIHPDTGDYPGADLADDESDEDEATVYSSLRGWVEDIFVWHFPRPLDGEWRWCLQWWDHTEAVSRLLVLWHTWEALHHRPGTGLSDWYMVLDHHLPILCGATGPFHACHPGGQDRPAKHKPNAPLDVSAPPASDPVNGDSAELANTTGAHSREH